MGRYRAVDLGDHLVVYATGTHPSIGYPVALKVVRGKADVPYLALYHGRPAPDAALMPAFGSFIVSAVLERRWVPHRPQFVIVLDARGEHQVEVTGPTDVGQPGERQIVCPGATSER